MTHQYKYYDAEQQTDVLVEMLYTREMEIHNYEVNVASLEHQVATLPDGDHRKLVQKRLESTMKQMAISKKALEGLETQITDPTAFAAAVKRFKAKKAATK